MQDDKPTSDEPKLQQSELSDRHSSPASSSGIGTDEFDSVLDVSGKNLELSLFDEGKSAAAADGLYVYRNVFNLMPKSLARFGGRLKTIKFFANEVNLFPPEFRDLVQLECLQVKVSPLGLNVLPFHKLKALKELELSKVPPRPSGFPILAEIAGLKSLTRLSVCHFSIRYLPPEIGCLSNLEYLDLSFNKIRSLPKEISSLNSLVCLKVANNKLVEVPAGLSSLQKLENLDLSRNRLTSLGLLELNTMRNLRNLNLQYNKLLSCQIPAWVCCNLEGNGKDICSDEFFNSTVEMDVFEATIDEDGSISCDESSNSLSCHVSGSSSNVRCCVKRRMGKRWKRRQYLQQCARQERLNHSRMWKADNHGRVLTIQSDRNFETCKRAVLASESLSRCPLDFSCVDHSKEEPSNDYEGGDVLDAFEDDGMSSKKELDQENCSCVDCVTNVGDRENNPDCSGISSSCASTSAEKEERSSSRMPKFSPKCKRQSDRLLDNPKPRKSRRSTDDHPDTSRKYNNTSFCSIKDCLPDGFYDAGRDRPFMSLVDYERTLELDSREVILLDRERDEELDSISLSAQGMVSRLKKLTGSRRRRDLVTDDNFLVASWLALFVSDHFGGTDRSCIIERTRKDVSGSNYRKPFVCTCATGNSESRIEPSKKNLPNVDDAVLREICEGSLKAIKASRNSVVVPIGTLQFGVCRHRAVLMKYLCDRMEPPVPCELVRGYLDFSPHAWNAVLVQRGGSWVRMIVDACRPHDIREEMDPEYFCRYVPLSRINCPEISPSIPASASCFPSLSACEEVEKAASSSIVLCKVGSIEAAAKVRTKEVSAASLDEIRNFEYTCLGEVRILGVLREHPCIVEIYGHRISSEWIAASDEKAEHRLLCSAILMEYVRGGSLKNYVEKLSKAGKKHVPVHLALCIARDVACALKELHSKHIIHRDIKSENILIDFDQKRADGSPTVKLSDFDRAVPLRSLLHTCCISHIGIPPPNICVGTPRWMAPEVLRTIDEQKAYGMEVDIWSYGCLLLELLTLQFPYEGLPDSKIHNLLKEGKRSPLTEDLELLGASEEPSKPESHKQLEGTTDKEVEGLRFLVDVFRQCTSGNPAERPTAKDLYEMVLAKTSTFISSSS